MDWLTQVLDGSGRSVVDPSPESLLLSLLAAFVLGQLVAWIYVWTHSGVSYSRSFTQSLILMTMVVTLVMSVIGNSIITAFGLIGAMAIIRFRNVLKDTRDTVFVFFVLVLGIGTGTQRYVTSILGTLAFGLVALYLFHTSFGTLGRFDGHLSLRLARQGDERELNRAIEAFCRSVKRISVRRGGVEETSEYLFQVQLRDPRRGQEFLDGLRALPSVSDPALVLRDELLEV
jgi:hypothetical protein